MINQSIILNTDSYKLAMADMYPPGTEHVYSYIESRGGDYTHLMAAGVQPFLRQYLSNPVTKEDVEQATELAHLSGQVFYPDRWNHLIKEHGGLLPLEIRWLPEGTVIPTNLPFVTVRNTDPRFHWTTTWVESPLLRAVYYSTTVATKCLNNYLIIREGWEKTCDSLDGMEYTLHDFGVRGVSSFESSGLGGLAHLMIFSGTDNLTALQYAQEFYGLNNKVAGHSVVASEHSVITSWGRDNEIDAYINLVEQFKGQKVISCVSDSYDIIEACRMWVGLKDRLQENGTTLVVRPDSGSPLEVLPRCLEVLSSGFGYETNQKGFKELVGVKLLWGDGIDHKTIENILSKMATDGWAANNFIFGQGGGLLQQLDRDTLKMAMKCSAVCVNGQWREVYKDPVTDSGKKSKRGLVSLYRNPDGSYRHLWDNNDSLDLRTSDDMLYKVYQNGNIESDSFLVVKHRTKLSIDRLWNQGFRNIER